MRKRDKEILEDLQRFRCLTRDDLIDLHFPDLKNPVTCCNTVLKRLRRDGHIEVSKDRMPYIYFPSPSGIKKDSAKIPHFLEIVSVYKDVLNIEKPRLFTVEPKYKKGFMEPDAFMIWKQAPFFVEIQRSVYSKKVMMEKYNRYLSYYMSDEWKQAEWQPTNKKVFPKVLLISDTEYNLPDHQEVRFIQLKSIHQLLMIEQQKNIQPPAPKRPPASIKIKIG